MLNLLVLLVVSILLSEVLGMSKFCRQCADFLPLSKFVSSEVYPDGVLPICRRCHRSNVRRSYYRHRFSVLERRARARAAAYGCFFEYVDYYEVFADKFSLPCELCGSGFSPSDIFEFHHVVALADGGAHVVSNITLVHRYCNRYHSARLFLLGRLFNSRVD